jgi:hypothetical protein
MEIIAGGVKLRASCLGRTTYLPAPAGRSHRSRETSEARVRSAMFCWRGVALIDGRRKMELPAMSNKWAGPGSGEPSGGRIVVLIAVVTEWPQIERKVPVQTAKVSTRRSCSGERHRKISPRRRSRSRPTSAAR